METDSPSGAREDDPCKKAANLAKESILALEGHLAAEELKLQASEALDAKSKLASSQVSDLQTIPSLPCLQCGAENRDARCVLYPSILRCWVQNNVSNTDHVRVVR